MSDEHILAVDREPDLLELYNRLLGGNGHTVYTTADSKRATQIGHQTPLDLVIVDFRVPDRDGLSLYEDIRSCQPDVMGVVTTCYPSMELAVDALHNGISSFVLKPFTPAELHQAVSHAFEQRRLRQENARLKTLLPLYELSRSLMNTTTLEALFNQVVKVATQESDADRASMMLEEQGELTIVAAQGLPRDVIRSTRTPIGEGVAGWAVMHGEPLLLDQRSPMPSELAAALQSEEIASAVCAPLTVGGRTFGVLNLTKLEGTERPFTPGDRDLISVLAGQVAVAIENARLTQREQRLAEQLARARMKLRVFEQAILPIRRSVTGFLRSVY